MPAGAAVGGALTSTSERERLVRRGDLQLRHAVAEVIVALDALAGRGVDIDPMREAALPGQGARRQAQQLLRQRNRRGIGVVRLVDDGVAHRVA